MLALRARPQLFFAGLIVIILGVGLLKPNISTLVAELYPEGGARRDAGFTIFYMGINLGAFIGPLIAGWLALRYGWRIGFLAAAVGMPLGPAAVLAVARPARRRRVSAHRPDGGAGLRRDWTALGIAVALLALLAFLLVSAGSSPVNPAPLAKARPTCWSAWRPPISSTCSSAPGSTRTSAGASVVVLVMFVACALFWSGFEQAGSSMNLFAKRHVDRFIGGFEIPAGWFQSVQPAFVILFAPVFSALWVCLARRNLDPPRRSSSRSA